MGLGLTVQPDILETLPILPSSPSFSCRRSTCSSTSADFICCIQRCGDHSASLCLNTLKGSHALLFSQKGGKVSLTNRASLVSPLSTSLRSHPTSPDGFVKDNSFCLSGTSLQNPATSRWKTDGLPILARTASLEGPHAQMSKRKTYPHRTTSTIRHRASWP